MYVLATHICRLAPPMCIQLLRLFTNYRLQTITTVVRVLLSTINSQLLSSSLSPRADSAACSDYLELLWSYKCLRLSIAVGLLAWHVQIAAVAF